MKKLILMTFFTIFSINNSQAKTWPLASENDICDERSSVSIPTSLSFISHYLRLKAEIINCDGLSKTFKFTGEATENLAQHVRFDENILTPSRSIKEDLTISVTLIDFKGKSENITFNGDIVKISKREVSFLFKDISKNFKMHLGAVNWIMVHIDTGVAVTTTGIINIQPLR